MKKLIAYLKQHGPYNVGYDLILGEEKYSLEDYLNQPIRLRYTGKIHCLYCGYVTTKSFNQGYCFPCFRSQAQCDRCIVMPEKCHFHKGTCRDETWALAHCMQDHIIYLANSSGVKVGITRATQLPQRWMDQGAIQALPIFQVNSRYHAGLVEVLCKAHVKDKTNWRVMLSNKIPLVDLITARDQLLKKLGSELTELGVAVLSLDKAEPIRLNYPVLQYPNPLGKALNFDKTPIIEGVLLGIKGQYLLLDSGVLNIRRFSGYEVVWDYL